MRRLRDLLVGHRDYRLLLSANVVSLLGDWILRTGLAYQVYVLTGSTLAMTGTLLASLLPQIALGSVAGVYADRWDRRRTMVAVNLLMAGTLLPLLAVQDAAHVWIVYAVVAVHSCLAPFFVAAEAAIVPTLVPTKHLVTANGLNGQTRDVARLVGAALGGVLAGVGGIGLLAIVNAATFAVASAILLAIRRSAQRTAGTGTAGTAASRSGVVRDWAEGVRIAWTSRTLRVFLAFIVLAGVGEATMGTLMPPFVRDVLGGDADAYGLIISAQAVGGLFGGLVTTLVGHRFSPRVLAGCGALVFGLLDLVLFLYPLVTATLWPAVVIMVLVGLPGALTVAGLMTIFQTATGDAHRGRVFGAAMALRSAAMLAGTTLAGTLGERIGIVPVIAVQGVGYCLAGLLVLGLLPIATPRTTDRVKEWPLVDATG
ncbi:MFS transporter [Plantactinospora sp. GCM10030261]|uniref:MFS transporter n=1 Tax=Plantactinospora sp. GCM10030261 TaxID=3273420 RepID=UPI0036112A2D